MTCIVGIEHAGGVLIGGDSAGCAGSELTIRSDQKVWKHGEFVFGYTSSFRMGQLLRYGDWLKDAGAAVPENDEAEFKWMVTVFVEQLRTLFGDGGYLKTESGQESAGTFLVGWRGKLYYIASDLQVGRSADGYDTCGSGGRVALGALHIAAGFDWEPRQQLRRALETAARFTSSVEGPFKIVEAKS